VFHKVIQYHGKLDFDIFHCHFGPNGLIAAWLKELGLLNGTIITTFHGYDANFNELYDKKYYYSSSSQNWSRLVFKHSYIITANTPYLMKQVIELGADPNRIELLPMGVDTSFFIPNENQHKQENIQLLSVGRLVKWKCHELGIQVVKNLIKEGFSLKYFIIGDGIERQNLERLIEILHLKKNVKMLGARNQSEVKKWMQESDVFLMTSAYDDSGRRETQGVVTAEAQACGLPVVAFRSGGIPYTLEERKTGFLAEEKNVSEFTQHLRKLCTNETLRKKMGQNARKFVEDNFCQIKLAQKQISLYEKVLIK
jgi:colanic acid/amylovoran biosynthesis glycosyltransferase